MAATTQIVFLDYPLRAASAALENKEFSKSQIFALDISF